MRRGTKLEALYNVGDMMVYHPQSEEPGEPKYFKVIERVGEDAGRDALVIFRRTDEFGRPYPGVRPKSLTLRSLYPHKTAAYRPYTPPPIQEESDAPPLFLSSTLHKIAEQLMRVEQKVDVLVSIISKPRRIVTRPAHAEQPQQAAPAGEQ